MGRRLAKAAVATAIVAGSAALPATAGAASSFTCEASALRGQILTAPAIEPITANQGEPTCKAVKAGGAGITDGLPSPLSISALAAQTTREGADAQPGSQKAGAIGGITDARVAPLGLPAIPFPTEMVPTLTLAPSSIPALPPLPAVPGLPVLPALPLPTQPVTVDLKPALQALLQQVQVDVLRLRVGVAFANASCVNGAAALQGSSQIAGLTVLGQELPTDKATDQALKVLDTQAIDPSNIDVSKIPLPAGVTPELLPTIQAAVQPLLDGLPTIAIPETLARVKVTPNQTIREGNSLTQRALQVQVSLLGQSLLDLTVGEASVSAANVVCAAESTVAAEQLSCTRKRLALVDVLRRGARVRLFGVADPELVGRRVTIRLRATGKVVSRPVVQDDGTFEANGPLPPRSIRDTGRARYQATVGREKSLDLKLVRRMIVSKLVSRNGRVTIAGRVTRPFGKPLQTIVVKRRVSCSKETVVARIKPSRSGAFSVTVAAPPSSLAATYRLATRVRGTASNPKLFDTFTLPRAVEVK